MSMKRTLLLVLATVLVLGGCASQRKGLKDSLAGMFDDKNPDADVLKKASEPRPLAKDFKPSITVKSVWDGRYGKGYEKYWLKLAPVEMDGRVFVADVDGRVIAIDAATGKVAWEDRDKRRPVSGGPGAGEGRVFVGTSNAQVVARDAASGKKLWIAQVSSEVLAAPAASNGLVFVRTGDGRLYALNAETGVQRWVLDRTTPTLTLRGSAPPVVHDGRVLAGFDNGRLSALELATGKELWEARLAEPNGRSDLERLVDVDARPIIRDGVAYIDSFQGRVAAVSLDDGSLVWTRDISSYEDVAVDDNNVYVTDERSYVWALSRADGSTVWRQKAFKNRKLTGPTRFGDYVVAGDLEGYVHWLDASTGTPVARERLDKNRLISAPVDIGGLLLGYSSSGELSAWRAK